MLIKTDEEIWEYYQHITEARRLKRTGKSYCEEYNIDYPTFRAFQVRIEYISISKPKHYKQSVELCSKFKTTGWTRAKFCREHNISLRLLTDTMLHLNYLDIIEKMKEENQEKPMSFIQVPDSPHATRNYSATANSYTQMVPAESAQSAEPEVIEPQNDLEIIISKGVKVSISPNVDTMQVVKIIEFLKDL